jgi:hypothetical protein
VIAIHPGLDLQHTLLSAVHGSIHFKIKTSKNVHSIELQAGLAERAVAAR